MEMIFALSSPYELGRRKAIIVPPSQDVVFDHKRSPCRELDTRGNEVQTCRI